MKFKKILCLTMSLCVCLAVTIVPASAASTPIKTPECTAYLTNENGDKVEVDVVYGETIEVPLLPEDVKERSSGIKAYQTKVEAKTAPKVDSDESEINGSVIASGILWMTWYDHPGTKNEAAVSKRFNVPQNAIIDPISYFSTNPISGMLKADYVIHFTNNAQLQMTVIPSVFS